MPQRPPTAVRIGCGSIIGVFAEEMAIIVAVNSAIGRSRV
jgi:hypothetical protein